jgi:hypothetical protein
MPNEDKSVCPVCEMEVPKVDAGVNFINHYDPAGANAICEGSGKSEADGKKAKEEKDKAKKEAEKEAKEAEKASAKADEDKKKPGK